MPYTGGMYSGVSYNWHPVDKTKAQTAQDFLDDLAVLDDPSTGIIAKIISNDQTNSVVNLTYVPFTYLGDHSIDNYPTKTIEIVVPNKIGNYSPRNKKLLTFPYIGLAVDTFDHVKSYRYEFFNFKGSKQIDGVLRDTVFFKVSGYVSANPVIVSAPKSYMCGQNEVNETEASYLNQFPQVAMTVDSFKASVANGSFAHGLLNMAQGAVSVGTSIAADIATGGATSMATEGKVASGIIGMAQSLNDLYHMQMRGDVARGVQAGQPHVASRSYNFYYKVIGVREEIAECIDGFMDRFGYTCNKLKIPNTHVRENWTYTKTNDCAIVGSIPVDDMRKIKSIFNNGITFWNNPYAVGNYSLSNRCLSEIPPSP